MVLTEKTLQVLKNYSNINRNILIKEGNVLKTISEALNVFASAEVDMTFPRTFGIYDLNEFLNVISLADSPRLTFENEHVLITDGTGRSKIKYFYAAQDTITCPKKDPTMPSDANISFVLDSETLSRIKRAASVLGHTELSVSVDNGLLNLSVIDSSDKTSNVFSIYVDGTFIDSDFELVFNISNLKMIDGDYDVKISDQRFISHFVNRDNGVQYWVALEKK
jgi:hypothetical protein